MNAFFLGNKSFLILRIFMAPKHFDKLRHCERVWLTWTNLSTSKLCSAIINNTETSRLSKWKNRGENTWGSTWNWNLLQKISKYFVLSNIFEYISKYSTKLKLPKYHEKKTKYFYAFKTTNLVVIMNWTFSACQNLWMEPIESWDLSFRSVPFVASDAH